MLQLLALLVYPSKNNQRISRAVSKNPRSLDQAQLQRRNVHKRFLLRFLQDQENDSSKNKTVRAEKHKRSDNDRLKMGFLFYEWQEKL